ncbi:XRE family transcriptional regulator [Shinella zoogloeoides]|uniref:helix-turn-helix domain-containing protein n=1 Tax=Shinella zoogloeoides TaxID=352475 RepID=UPI0028A99479|nr:XRE family transcriptional regulator [Shinella zoogloeoides]
MRQVEPNAMSLGTVPQAGQDVRGCLRAVLSRIITDAGLSQTQAAKRCGTDQPTLSKLLSGRSDSVSADQMLRWMVVLGCQIEINVHPRQQSPGNIKATLHE